MTTSEIVQELINLESKFTLHHYEDNSYITVVLYNEVEIEVRNNKEVYINNELVLTEDVKELMFVIFGHEYIESKI